MTTIKDIARKTGFSVSTVSRALNNTHVDEETRRTILECAEKLDYHPNYNAQSLKVKKSRTIAYLIPDIENLLYPSLASAIEQEARLLGYSLLLCNTFDDPEFAKRYVNELRSRYVDGFIFSTAMADPAQNEAIHILRNDQYPCACIMRGSDDGLDSVVVDNVKGSELAIDYLVGNGLRDIVYLSGSMQLKLYQERLEGYRRRLSYHGIPVSEENIISGFDDSSRIGYEAVKNYLATGKRPDAVYAASDPLALEAMKAISDSGLRVPDDISVIGFDDLPVSSLCNPGLTTVSQPFKEMGKFVVRKLVSMIENPSCIGKKTDVFDVSIVERGSVKRREK